MDEKGNTAFPTGERHINNCGNSEDVNVRVKVGTKTKITQQNPGQIQHRRYRQRSRRHRRLKKKTP